FLGNLLKADGAATRSIVKIRQVDTGVTPPETAPGLNAAGASRAMRRNADRTWVDRPVRVGIRTFRVQILLLLLVLGLSRTTTTAEASPIKHHAIATRPTRGVQVWDEFVAWGPSFWARVHPPTMSAQTSQTMHEVWKHELKSADPASYPNIQYLLWR